MTSWFAVLACLATGWAALVRVENRRVAHGKANILVADAVGIRCPLWDVPWSAVSGISIKGDYPTLAPFLRQMVIHARDVAPPSSSWVYRGSVGDSVTIPQSLVRISLIELWTELEERAGRSLSGDDFWSPDFDDQSADRGA
jgi:hypothetical protein